jgi:hypothetical protein
MSRFKFTIEDEINNLYFPNISCNSSAISINKDKEVKDKKENKKSNNNKKEKFKDIDDLIKYINGEEEDKPKKSKKKINKKDKKIQTNAKSTNLNNLPMVQGDKEKIEMEIEEFKNCLKSNSIPAYSIKKIQPNFSKEWLLDLGRGVKSS